MSVIFFENLALLIPIWSLYWKIVASRMTSRSLAAAARPVVNWALYKALQLSRLILLNTTPVKLEFIRRKIKYQDDE